MLTVAADCMTYTRDTHSRAALSCADAPIAFLHARDEAGAAKAVARLRAAYRIGEAPPPGVAPVVARIVGAGT